MQKTLRSTVIYNQSSNLANNKPRNYSRLQALTSVNIKSSWSVGAISGSTVATYFGIFLMIVSVMVLAYHPPVNERALAETPLNNVANQSQVNSSVSVDQLVATDLASSLAESTYMPISNNVANLSQSLAVESALAQNDVNVISKPQIVQLSADGRTIQSYTTVAGDSVQTIADKFKLNPETVKWVNNLTSDAVEPGKVLTILPVDGVLYTVKSGDTVDSITNKYKSDKSSTIAYNDLELSGNPAVGSKIVLPGAVLPSNERPGYVAPRTQYYNYSGGYGNAFAGIMSAGNRYAWGNCTWYAYERRLQLGLPVGSFWGNANTWASYAIGAGMLVDGNPTPGAIMQNGGGYGHVSIVESVIPGVSVTISEMNGYRFGGGFNRVGHGDISWAEATSGNYRYIH